MLYKCVIIIIYLLTQPAYNYADIFSYTYLFDFPNLFNCITIVECIYIYFIGITSCISGKSISWTYIRNIFISEWTNYRLNPCNFYGVISKMGLSYRRYLVTLLATSYFRAESYFISKVGQEIINLRLQKRSLVQ